MKHVQNYAKINGIMVVTDAAGLAYANINGRVFIFESLDAAREYIMEGTKEDEC